MTGYNLEKGLIYMAVVVHDKDLVVDNKDVIHTDSVEIYVDGLMSEHVYGEPPTDQTTGASVCRSSARRAVCRDTRRRAGLWQRRRR